MPESAELRGAIADARHAREAVLRHLHDLQARLAASQRLVARFSPGSPEGQALAATIADLQNGQIPQAQNDADAAGVAFDQAMAAYDTAAAAEPPVWTEGGDLPVLLLPLRLETVYRAAGAGAELWIRAYPDDVHVDAHERGLTERERSAGEAYWRAVWAAGPNEERRAIAWRTLLADLGLARAAWTREQLRPAEDPPGVETPEDEPGPDPGPFPAVESRPGTWTRAAHTSVLPDRLVFSAYRGGKLVWRHEATPIPDVVTVGFAPPEFHPPDDEPEGDRRDVPWDRDSRWLVDFEAAMASGLGIKVTLDEPDLGFDLLTAVGVSPATDPGSGAQRVQDLLEGHTYAGGLAVLPAGTPTNNTPESRAGWRSRPQPRSPEAVDAQRAAYAPAGDQPAARVARALAIDGANALAIAPDALEDDEPLTARIHSLVGRLYETSPDWKPPNEPPFQPHDLSACVEHFASFVRSRGPLPTLRIGRQPYGLLPATALDVWRGDDVDERIVAAVHSARTYVEDQAYRAPRVGTGPDQDAVILDILSRRAASRRVRRTDEDQILEVPGPPATLGILPVNSPFALRSSLYPPATELTAADQEPASELLALIALKPLAELGAIAEEVSTTLRAWDPNTPQPSFDDLQPRLTALKQALEPVLESSAAGVLYPLAVPILSWSIVVAFFSELVVAQGTAAAEVVAAFKRVAEGVVQMRTELVALEELAATELVTIERLLCECLDTTSHRLDAWATSLATARLRRLRETHPAGLQTGAYGWLTDVRPTEPGLREVDDGYVVTPSMHHAATAAVLRSGWLAHTDRKALAVNLTSARVRRALALLDGARSGQPLPALLGYQFERGLHDAGLDGLVAPFRDRYPLAPVVDPAADGADEARAAIAARNVVDGQALRRDRAAFDPPGPAPGPDGRPPPVSPDHPGIGTVRALIAGLDESVDALGDLLLAESVHHLVGGNPLRAGVSADAIGRGEGVPDELDVITTPRSGATVTYAFGLLAPGGPEQGGWQSDRPLGRLEPALERWCAARLGASDGWRCRVAMAAGDPVEVSIADLHVSALEAVLGARPDGPLARWIVRAAGAGAVKLVEGDDRFAELTALAGRLRLVAAGATPLHAGHLDPATQDPWAPADLPDLVARVRGWLGDVRDAVEAVKTAPPAPDALRTALDGLAAAGIGAAAWPAGDAADAERLAARAADALAAVEAARLPDAIPAPPEGEKRNATTTLEWLTGVTAAIHSLLGDGFALLPVLRLGADAGALLAAEHRPQGAGDDAVIDWVREVGSVRPEVRALDETLMAAEVLAGGAAPAYAVVQSPAGAGAPWVALGPPPEGPAGRSCCVLATNEPADPSALAGLVVDAWSEVVPRAARKDHPPEEVAAIAFHHARPDARAPQALLLAVPPDPARGWRMEDLHGVVEDTLTLARVRGLDLADLPELRGVVPPENPANVGLDLH